MSVLNGVLLQPEAWQNFATRAAAVTPGPTTFADPTRYLYVGAAGSVTVIMAGDASMTPVTFAAVPAGTLLPIAVIAVTVAAGGGVVALF
jgi:hypothetical protein